MAISWIHPEQMAGGLSNGSQRLGKTIPPFNLGRPKLLERARDVLVILKLMNYQASE